MYLSRGKKTGPYNIFIRPLMIYSHRFPNRLHKNTFFLQVCFSVPNLYTALLHPWRKRSKRVGTLLCRLASIVVASLLKRTYGSLKRVPPMRPFFILAIMKAFLGQRTHVR